MFTSIQYVCVRPDLYIAVWYDRGQTCWYGDFSDRKGKMHGTRWTASTRDAVLVFRPDFAKTTTEN